ncbi:MAG: hypothetical protein KAH06_01480 [Desulfobacterales bacterium]|nr:hypothetical protein [Desulfobacterales bacterium]
MTGQDPKKAVTLQGRTLTFPPISDGIVAHRKKHSQVLRNSKTLELSDVIMVQKGITRQVKASPGGAYKNKNFTN